MKGEPTGKNCRKCGEPTVWKTSKRSLSGFTPVCPSCKRAWAISARGRAVRRGADRTYRKTEAGIRNHRNKQSRRRAREFLAECPKCLGSEYYDVQREALCYICGDAAEATDHIYPLAVEGLHCNENFAPICTDCNSVKHARIWPGHPEWEKFVLSQKEKLSTKK